MRRVVSELQRQKAIQHQRAASSAVVVDGTGASSSSSAAESLPDYMAGAMTEEEERELESELEVYLTLHPGDPCLALYG
jgi:hypothetical protein